jgi:peptidylprolyl isomerase
MPLEDLNKKIIKEGTGTETCPKGVTAVVHYTGRFSNETGKVFDSSRDRGQHFTFTVGAGEVIAAWDIAIQSMKKGERATYICPPELCYGDRGAGGVIPPSSVLFFDIELIEWKTGGGGWCTVQ